MLEGVPGSNCAVFESRVAGALWIVGVGRLALAWAVAWCLAGCAWCTRVDLAFHRVVQHGGMAAVWCTSGDVHATFRFSPRRNRDIQMSYEIDISKIAGFDGVVEVPKEGASACAVCLRACVLLPGLVVLCREHE